MPVVNTGVVFLGYEMRCDLSLFWFFENPPERNLVEWGGWLWEGTALHSALCWPTSAINTEGEDSGKAKEGWDWERHFPNNLSLLSTRENKDYALKAGWEPDLTGAALKWEDSLPAAKINTKQTMGGTGFHSRRRHKITAEQSLVCFGVQARGPGQQTRAVAGENAAETRSV